MPADGVSVWSILGTLAVVAALIVGGVYLRRWYGPRQPPPPP